MYEIFFFQIKDAILLCLLSVAKCVLVMKIVKTINQPVAIAFTIYLTILYLFIMLIYVFNLFIMLTIARNFN